MHGCVEDYWMSLKSMGLIYKYRVPTSCQNAGCVSNFAVLSDIKTALQRHAYPDLWKKWVAVRDLTLCSTSGLMKDRTRLFDRALRLSCKSSMELTQSHTPGAEMVNFSVTVHHVPQRARRNRKVVNGASFQCVSRSGTQCI